MDRLVGFVSVADLDGRCLRPSRAQAWGRLWLYAPVRSHSLACAPNVAQHNNNLWRRALEPRRGETPMTIRVLIADDHAVVRQGLRLFLGSDPELAVVGEARDGAEALRLAGELHPEVVLMDLVMPVMDGIAATAALRRALPDVEVVAVTSVLGDASVAEAMDAGAIGYLLKTTEAPALCAAIKAAAAGQVQLSSEAARRLLRANAGPRRHEALTEREMDILRFLAKGYSNKAIAQALDIGVQTVKSHVAHVLGKLGVSSRTQAVLQAMQAGLIPAVGTLGECQLGVPAGPSAGPSTHGPRRA